MGSKRQRRTRNRYEDLTDSFKHYLMVGFVHEDSLARRNVRLRDWKPDADSVNS